MDTYRPKQYFPLGSQAGVINPEKPHFGKVGTVIDPPEYFGGKRWREIPRGWIWVKFEISDPESIRDTTAYLEYNPDTDLINTETLGLRMFAWIMHKRFDQPLPVWWKDYYLDDLLLR